MTDQTTELIAACRAVVRAWFATPIEDSRESAELARSVGELERLSNYRRLSALTSGGETDKGVVPSLVSPDDPGLWLLDGLISYGRCEPAWNELLLTYSTDAQALAAHEMITAVADGTTNKSSPAPRGDTK